ncbi:hypothetical protein DL98DRAFT_519605 [Cadophora sp. DSE1049]|nr:hypothetical protein DL98DRAFT_519605 [Cadophora sp. DSE1049]
MATSTPTTSNRDLLTSGPRPANPFTFSTGDTKILVTYKGDKIEGLVSSHALSMASPVWKNFIYPPWNTQNAGGDNGAADGTKSIDCSEDDGEALLVLMNIVHLKFVSVPKKPTLDALVQVAQLCEQYQCVSIVAPWVNLWKTNCPLTRGPHELLFVSWTFGWGDTFKILAHVLVQCITISEVGVPLDGRWMPMVGLMPPGILDKILEIRIATLDSLLAIAAIEISRYTSGPRPVCRQIPSSQRSWDSMKDSERLWCDEKSLRRLRLDLAGIGWPLRSGSECNKNVVSVSALLCSIKARARVAIGRTTLELDHRDCCSANFLSDPEKVISEIKSPVLDSHIEHMRIQRTKLGMMKED